MGSAGAQGELWSHNPETWNLQEQFHAPLFEAMLTAANVTAGTRMLDAGCGSGTAAAMAVSRGATVTGIDAAQGLIAHAKSAVPMAEFSVGDIEHLEFDDDSFDVVFAANSVQYAENLIPTLRELRRVCAKGGIVVAGLFGPPEGVDYRAVFAAAKAAMPPPPPGAKPGGPFALSESGALAGKVEEADLKVVDVGKVNCPFTYKNFEEKWRISISAGPFQAMMKVIGEDALKAAVHTGCEAFTAEDGSIRFPTNEFIYVVAKP